jgi:hypothetical protein
MNAPVKLQLKSFVKKVTWLGGLNSHGWGNGYVCLPEGHPCYGMDYDAIHEKYDMDVHGGLTLSCSSEGNEWPEQPEGKWWIVGFDTAHHGDSFSRWPKAAVKREAERLLKQLEAITE